MSNLENKTNSIEMMRHRGHQRRRAISILGAVVVLATALALMMPAISMTWNSAPQGSYVAGTSSLSGYPAQSFSQEANAGQGTATVAVQVEAPEGALPANAKMTARLVEDTEVTDAAKEEAVAKADISSEGARAIAVDIAFFDEDGNEVEPLRDVNVSMRAHAIAVQDQLAIVHVDDENKAAVVPVEMVDAEGEQVVFTANQFSVYALVYTVDFSFEFDGKLSSFSITGGEAVGLKELLVALGIVGDGSGSQFEDPADFVSFVDKVEFSDPDLVWIGNINEDTMVYDLMAANGLQPIYRSGTTENEFTSLVTKVLDGPDWALMALQPFDTEEALVITMLDGSVLTVKVTDEQNAPMTTDATGNMVVETITNPSGTTIDLFDYWVVDNYWDSDVNPARQINRDTQGRAAWPGHNNVEDPFSHDFIGYDCDNAVGEKYAADPQKSSKDMWVDGGLNPGILKGNGNNKGINQGHAFKFTDSSSQTVINGTLGVPNIDNAHLVNSWTGNADPTQGLVTGTLVDGYPKLSGNTNLGVNDESLAYLFDDSTHGGKQKYGDVDHLLYVDPDGYYTYDSRDYAAVYDESSNNFVLTEQTSDDGEIRGFWPFGDRVYWCGMHMNTQFSMPKNGIVVNPKNEEKEMQFEFSGDDDTLLYVDGVLVGDGGGIHNRTEIDINFAQGKVYTYGTKDPKHPGGTLEQEQWLDDIFKAAGTRPDGKPYYIDEEWEAIPGTDHKRFKAGTYHTFDMFYLERGGGESNLYIHYNLVSTADFTGHKAYDGFPEDDMMRRNQFQFEMIGLDGRYESVPDGQGGYELVEAEWSGGSYSIPQNNQAIMPTSGSSDGDGTVENPRKTRGEMAVDGTMNPATFYTVGVTEDGNINFGDALVSEAEKAAKDAGHASVYRYIIREVVPDDAVNADGVRWGQATEQQKRDNGPFVKDQVSYDGTIYYMAARVTSWEQTGADGVSYTRYGLSKTYYEDGSFTTVKPNTDFVDFRNTYAPEYGRVDFSKVDGFNQPLPGAQFTLYSNKACTTIAKDRDGNDLVVTTGPDGRVAFENVPVREYNLKETAVPAGYAENDTVYTVVIESDGDRTKKSKVYSTVDGFQVPLNSIVNYRQGEISVIKEWQAANGEAAHEGKPVKVKLLRKRALAHTVSFTISIDGRSDLSFTKTGYVTGGDLTVDWWDTNQSISSFTVKDDAGNNMQYRRSDYWDGTNHKNRRVVIPNVTTDVYISVTYPTDVDWLFNSEHTKWMKDVSGLGADDINAVDDDDFNNSTAASHIATLDSRNHWATTWIIDDGEFPASDANGRYYYYIGELKDDGTVAPVGSELSDGVRLKEIVYNPALGNQIPGIQQGSVTVVNEVDSQPISVVIKKTDGNAENPSYLGGAKFRLEYRVDEASEWAKASKDAIAQLDDNGEFAVPGDANGITLAGLVDGQYRLVETEAPHGYVIDHPIPVVFTVSGGAITSTEGTIEAVTYTAAQSAAGQASAPLDTFTIPNTPGKSLPSTGGAGTIGFTLIGVLMVALGVCALVLNNRVRVTSRKHIAG